MTQYLKVSTAVKNTRNGKMAGLAVNTMIEDSSIECEDSKILNTNLKDEIEKFEDGKVKDKPLNRKSESENFTTGNDVSARDSNMSISSEQLTVCKNVSSTVSKNETFSEASEADSNSLKYFDEICSADKGHRLL